MSIFFSAVVCYHSQCLEGHIQCDSTVWWRCSSWCGCTVLISTSKHHVFALIQLVSTFVCLFWFPSTPFSDFWCPEGLKLNHILPFNPLTWLFEKHQSMTQNYFLTVKFTKQKQTNTQNQKKTQCGVTEVFWLDDFTVLSGGDPLASTSWFSSQLHFTLNVIDI